MQIKIGNSDSSSLIRDLLEEMTQRMEALENRLRYR